MTNAPMNNMRPRSLRVSSAVQGILKILPPAYSLCVSPVRSILHDSLQTASSSSSDQLRGGGTGWVVPSSFFWTQQEGSDMAPTNRGSDITPANRGGDTTVLLDVTRKTAGQNKGGQRRL